MLRTGLIQQLMPDKQGRAERSAGVTGGRLNPNPLERPLAEQSLVRHAIQGNPTGQNEISLFSSTMQLARHSQHGVSQHGLNTGCQVSVSLLEWGLGLPRRSAK